MSKDVKRVIVSPGLTKPSVRRFDMPCIRTSPVNPLVDDVLSVEVTGLTAGAPYTVKSRITENGANFSACGWFSADNSGVIDVTNGYSAGGTFTGFEAMGLFWGMRQEPGHRRVIRIIKTDVTTPIKVILSVYKGHHTWEDMCSIDQRPVITDHINRWYMPKDVKRVIVRAGSVRGRLFIPPGKGPFPGVIDIFGGMGGVLEHRASLLASRGFATLALPYFNFEDLPTLTSEFINLKIDYFLEAADYLSSHNSVQGNKIGVIGVSKGAEFAGLMARYSHKVAAAVLINGPPYLSVSDMDFGDGIYRCVDKHQGFDFSKLKITKEGIEYRDAYHYFTPSDIFELWKTDVKVLTIVGEDDRVLNPEIPKVLLHAYPKHKASSIQLLSYPGAGHLIEPPFMPLCRKSYVRHLDMNQVWGGKERDHSLAQQDSWLKMNQFLKTNLNNEYRHMKSSL